MESMCLQISRWIPRQTDEQDSQAPHAGLSSIVAGVPATDQNADCAQTLTSARIRLSVLVQKMNEKTATLSREEAPPLCIRSHVPPQRG